MRNKLIGVVVVAVALLAGGIVFRQLKPGAPPRPPIAPASATVPAPAEIAEQSDADADEQNALQRTQSLKGKDFSLDVYVNGNELFRNVDISMDDNRAIRWLRPLHRDAWELASMTFSPADVFELINLIPGEAREQIICKGSTALSAGQGIVGNYSVFRIEGDTLKELFNVITERERDGEGETPPQRLEAHVEPTTRNGQPAFIYRVKVEKAPEKTIVFLWNGKQFEDASGE
ncbi:MAG: hypothetical protein V4578_25880, partial [Pseudomonadota bacterium]